MTTKKNDTEKTEDKKTEERPVAANSGDTWVIGSSARFAVRYAEEQEIDVPARRCVALADRDRVPANAKIVVAKMVGDRSALWAEYE